MSIYFTVLELGGLLAIVLIAFLICKIIIKKTYEFSKGYAAFTAIIVSGVCLLISVANKFDVNYMDMQSQYTNTYSYIYVQLQQKNEISESTVSQIEKYNNKLQIYKNECTKYSILYSDECIDVILSLNEIDVKEISEMINQNK